MADTTKTPTAKSTKNLGRPKTADPPRVSYHDLDRLLVFGEVVDKGNGMGPVTKYPSYRELAARYGVSHSSLVATYASRHQCLHRRDVARQRLDARTDDKLIEQRASAIADCKVQALDIIEGFITEFRKALADGRVRSDSVSDFNMMVRLKEYLQGGADSRTETRGVLSLESLQERYARAHQRDRDDPALTGMVEPGRAPHWGGQVVTDDPPRLPSEDGRRDVHGHFADGTDEGDDEALDGADDAAENTAAFD